MFYSNIKRRIQGLSKAAKYFLYFQTLVPSFWLAARWIGEGSTPRRSHHFSWQMYSNSGNTQYIGTFNDGSTAKVSHKHLIPILREARYSAQTPTQLCKENTELLKLKLVLHGKESRFECVQ